MTDILIQIKTWFAKKYRIPTLGEGANFRLTAHPPDGDYKVPIQVRDDEKVVETTTLVRVTKGEIFIDPDNPNRPIDTTNKFFLGQMTLEGESRVIIQHRQPLNSSLCKADALNLAAWLAVLADPEGKEFARVLEAVRCT